METGLPGKGPQRRPQRHLGRRLEEVAKAVGGGYCRLQMPLRLALAVRETVAGHGLGALEGGVTPPPLPMHPWLGVPAEVSKTPSSPPVPAASPSTPSRPIQHWSDCPLACAASSAAGRVAQATPFVGRRGSQPSLCSAGAAGVCACDLVPPPGRHWGTATPPGGRRGRSAAGREPAGPAPVCSSAGCRRGCPGPPRHHSPGASGMPPPDPRRWSRSHRRRPGPPQPWAAEWATDPDWGTRPRRGYVGRSGYRGRQGPRPKRATLRTSPTRKPRARHSAECGG